MSIPILNRKMILNKKTESTEAFSTLNFVVGRDGFEPSKAKPTDLQFLSKEATCLTTKGFHDFLDKIFG